MIRPLIDRTKQGLSEQDSSSESEQNGNQPIPIQPCSPVHPARVPQPIQAPPSPIHRSASRSPRSPTLTVSGDSIISVVSSEDGAIVGSGDEYIWDNEEFLTPVGPPREGRNQQDHQDPPGEGDTQPAQGASRALQSNFQDSPPESILDIENLNENPQFSPIQRWGWNTPSRITRASLSGGEMRPTTSSKKTKTKRK